ncbi:unnamed protein product [Rotaria sordida]|uniref:Uncharacterized protein n=1 Tax=Rotaria sordida TaxID=392033 RepID=A0A813XI82_9BILA|nr:unnamed protein product [Rotaria sordida]CAF0870963.1 unnamed protein product [Rotaria sordida]
MYNWTLDNRTSNFNLSRKIIHAIDAESNFANDIQNTKFIETWAKYDDIEIYTNLDLVSDIFRNPFIRNNKIIDMFLLHVPLEQLTLHSLFPFLFEILFQPSLEVANALQPILQAIENGYMFTCIHLRMGQNPSNPLDDRFQDRSSAVKDIIDFLNRTNLRKMRNTRVFIASDSEQVVSNIASQFPNQTITIPGPILHIDRPADGINLVHGFLRVVIEFYMLGECYTSIFTASGFSALANRRRTEPYQNLFKYDGSNRRIERCHDIYESAQPPKIVLVALYCRVIFNCSSREI